MRILFSENFARVKEMKNIRYGVQTCAQEQLYQIFTPFCLTNLIFWTFSQAVQNIMNFPTLYLFNLFLREHSRVKFWLNFAVTESQTTGGFPNKKFPCATLSFQMLCNHQNLLIAGILKQIYGQNFKLFICPYFIQPKPGRLNRENPKN